MKDSSSSSDDNITDKDTPLSNGDHKPKKQPNVIRNGSLKGSKFLEPNVALTALLDEKTPYFTTIPPGPKRETYLTVDYAGDIKRDKVPYHDDCGVWSCMSFAGSTYKTCYVHDKGSLTLVTKGKAGNYCHRQVTHQLTDTQGKFLRVKVRLDPQPTDDQIIIVTRYNTSLNSDPTYKRRISIFEKLPTSTPPSQPWLWERVLVEYSGEVPIWLQSRENGIACERTTLPKVVMDDVDSSRNLSRSVDVQQCSQVIHPTGNVSTISDIKIEESLPTVVKFEVPPTSEHRFVCETCNEGFPRASSLLIHKLTHRSEPINAGASLFDGFPSKKRIETISREGLFVCATCQREFNRDSDLRQHERTHRDKHSSSCQTCGKEFIELSHLRNHEATHLSESPFKCKTCDKLFNNAVTLIRHESGHAMKLRHVCRVCDKGFRKPLDLRRHESTHTSERRFTCKTCDRRFTNVFNLQRHETIHAGERKFVCKTCAMRFTRANSLYVHERTHVTSEKRFSCATCKKSFVHLDELRKHELKHKNERLYVCPTCGKCIKTLSSFYRHQRLHTRDEKINVCGKYNKRFEDSECLRRDELNDADVVCEEISVKLEPMDDACDPWVERSDDAFIECHQLFINRSQLDEHRLTTHWFGCGICGEMSNKRDQVKTCFYNHLSIQQSQCRGYLNFS